MMIKFHEQAREFHLQNQWISYVIRIFESGRAGNLYFGKMITDREDFSHLLPFGDPAMAVYPGQGDDGMSLQHIRLEYPVYGTGDFRQPAIEICQENGSRITEFFYERHRITSGKKKLEGLPASYVEDETEAETLELMLKDKVCSVRLILSYTIYRDYPVICRNTQVIHEGEKKVRLERVFSASLDLPDADYEMVQLSGAWSRERHIKTRKIQQGFQGVSSMRGCSSAEHNPFIALKRPFTTEDQGEAIGFSLVYSGNHMEQVEVDTNHMTRVLTGIHPDTFSWLLSPGESFQSPEAVIMYSDCGMNGLSQSFHRFFRNRLASGYWRDRVRPVLVNNWEATEAAFTEEQILKLGEKAKELGIELLVLDDGWFGGREDDTKGLGDWYVTNFQKLPEGITGLSRKVKAMGLKFGLWFEPEMVNLDTDLYRAHPEWTLKTPERPMSKGRNQYVLDFSNEQVVDYIYGLMEKVIGDAEIDYVKWDMNRYISECYSSCHQAEDQGKIFHKYILGVYRLYERLTARFPEILFESCASGGARFDPGMLHYAPQAWTSDDTDAIERLKIQYGTSLVYPVSSMGAHVSAVPNQQTGRMTSFKLRTDTAMFGAFGYELDLNALTEEELSQIKKDIQFVKDHRRLIQFGTFYRILSPFEGDEAAWMVVSEDKKEALVACFRLLGEPNKGWDRLYLKGLEKMTPYVINGDESRFFYGDELMNAGVPLGHTGPRESDLDFTSRLFYLKAAE